MLNHFHLIPKRHGRTDGRTDRIATSMSRVSVLTRDKNLLGLQKTGTSETLNHHPHTAVHRNAAIVEVSRSFGNILL